MNYYMNGHYILTLRYQCRLCSEKTQNYKVFHYLNNTSSNLMFGANALHVSYHVGSERSYGLMSYFSPRLLAVFLWNGGRLEVKRPASRKTVLFCIFRLYIPRTHL